MNDPFILFKGLEHMLTGIAIPFCVALAACLVRIAFWGWTGFRAFFANFIIAFVLGSGAHWLMADMEVGDSTRLFVTLGVALISKDMLDTIFSHSTKQAVQDRIAFEISSRFSKRRPAHMEMRERESFEVEITKDSQER